MGTDIIFAPEVSLKEIKNRKIIKVSENRNEEWINLLAAICTVAMKIFLYFI